jgi:predicted translin family RNA/ssDNA-binding protein
MSAAAPAPADAAPAPSAIARVFQEFAAELDETNARRERVYKLARDITKASKDTISLLHRIKGGGAALQPAENKLRQVEALVARLRDELRDERDVHRFKPSYGFGLQEYIEALSFYRFLVDGALVRPEEAEQRFAAQHPAGRALPLSTFDYVMGVSDLVGELMRYATNALPDGRHEVPLAVCGFVRDLQRLLEQLRVRDRDWGKKLEALRESVEKIERLCFRLRLRRDEFPDAPLLAAAIEADLAAQSGGDDRDRD